MDMSQYLGVFIDEAREHLQNLNDKMLELENSSDDPELINSIFRSAHTLKGSSGQMGFNNMMELTHSMENVFDAMRHGKVNVSSEIVDILFETLDHLEVMIDQIEKGESDAQDVTATLKKLQFITAGPGTNGKDSGQETGDGRTVKKADQPVPSGNGSLVMNDYEKAAVDQALARQMKVFETAVTLRSDCLLKAARAVMVSNALESIGNIVKSVPEAAEIEKGKFDRTFRFVIVTNKSEEEIRSAVLSVSEIEHAEIQPIMSSDNGNNRQEEKPSGKENKQQKQKGRRGTEGSKRTVAKTIRVNLDRLDHLLNLFEEMIINRSRLEKVSQSLENPELKETVDTLKKVSDQLQETILNLRMEPVEQVFNRFPRMVRSLSKELDKKVRLEISGADTELDRTVIDEIGDPLMHMIRNSMDHGIEHPDVREKIGKSSEGTLALRAYHSGNHVFIEIEDDGAGINREKVLSKAVEKGIVTKEAANSMSDKDVYHLLFESGFSTADRISDISGRGVGLDVVESKIHSLSGTIELNSVPGQGTKFTIKLPLTLSIINAMLIQSGEEVYAVPITSIAETVLRRQVKIQSIHQHQVITFRDKVVPLIGLRDYLNIPGSESSDPPAGGNESEAGSIVLVRQGDRMIGILTDRLLGYQDIVIKPLSRFLKNVKGFSGATILGDGKVALILDCQAMIEKQKKTVPNEKQKEEL
ncbi:chemotaxis protein CheA [Sporolactobacillus sp. THM7-4]|nr:chemotaxis protein CheA [Sporolactobacillus sp. THM7-4]